jgi:hypothetical protein
MIEKCLPLKVTDGDLRSTKIEDRPYYAQAQTSRHSSALATLGYKRTPCEALFFETF